MAASKEQLREFLVEHLPYEISMMRCAYKFLTLEIKNQYFFNIVMEFYFVHARTLIEFFRKKQTVKALHFTNESYKSPASDGYLEAINKQIVHLGTNRSKLAAGKLSLADVDRLNIWIESELTKFQAALDPEWSSLFVMPADTAHPSVEIPTEHRFIQVDPAVPSATSHITSVSIVSASS